MKKISILLTLGLVLGLASCSDNYEANPHITGARDFKLNTPSYAGIAVDLERTDSMAITWSQPQYTDEYVPLPLSYEILVSLSDKYVISLDSADNDMTGQTKADYVPMARTTQKCSYNIINNELDSLVMRLGGYKSAADVPANLPVYLRVNAFIQENLKRLDEHQSNSVQIKTIPYYKEIIYLDPITWYMVGYGIGNKGWGNDGESAVGQSLIPLFLIPGQKYNKVKGTGVVNYTGWFYKGQKFRMVSVPGVWDQDHGYMQLINDPDYYTLFEDGGDNNIKVLKSNYYTLTVNTATSEISMSPYTEDVETYDALTASGKSMTAVFTQMGTDDKPTVEDSTDPLQVVENHMWSLEVEGGDKFKVTAGTKTWGYVKGLQASGDAEGNIVIPDGSWLFLFNDITGNYMLIKR